MPEAPKEDQDWIDFPETVIKTKDWAKISKKKRSKRRRCLGCRKLFSPEALTDGFCLRCFPKHQKDQEELKNAVDASGLRDLMKF